MSPQLFAARTAREALLAERRAAALAAAASQKNSGNARFGAKDFGAAAEFYSAALRRVRDATIFTQSRHVNEAFEEGLSQTPYRKQMQSCTN